MPISHCLSQRVLTQGSGTDDDDNDDDDDDEDNDDDDDDCQTFVYILIWLLLFYLSSRCFLLYCCFLAACLLLFWLLPSRGARPRHFFDFNCRLRGGISVLLVRAHSSAYFIDFI